MGVGTRTRDSGSALGRWSIGRLLPRTKRSRRFGSPSGILSDPSEVRRLLIRSEKRAEVAAAAVPVGLVLAAAASAAEAAVQPVLQWDQAQEA